MTNAYRHLGSGTRRSAGARTPGYPYGPDRKLALAAVQAYARLGHQPDAVAVLEHALAQKIIRSDDFAQALALALPHVAPHGQAEHAARLARTGSAFGAQVLALTLGSEAEVARLRAPDKTLIAALHWLAVQAYCLRRCVGGPHPLP